MYKKKFPCANYFGNLCSGFGGTLDCHGCGWHMFEHSYREALLKEYIEKEYPKYSFDEFKARHPDVEFDITYNDYYDWWEVKFEGLLFEILRPSDEIEELFRLCCIHEWGKNG